MQNETSTDLVKRRTLIPLVMAACTPSPGGFVHEIHGKTMGTTWSVRFVAVRTFDASIVAAGVSKRLDEVVRQMSTWDESSDLCRFNASAPGTWVPLPHAFFKVLRYALDVARQSSGAYDPTAGALVNAWGFGPINRFDQAPFRAPGAASVDAAIAVSGWQRLQLDSQDRAALQQGGTVLDLSAIAKGFAVDHVASYLHEIGIDDCLVEIGGELRGDGIKPDGQPWWVGLEQPPRHIDPAAFEELQTLVALQDISVATSGDYRRYFVDGDKRYSHTIDPRNGMPVAHGVASVTVLHRECMAADAWSTALGVLGVDEGIALADEHGLAALFIEREASGHFIEHMSEQFEVMLS